MGIPIVMPPGFGVITPEKLASLQAAADMANVAAADAYKLKADKWVAKCLNLNKITPDKPIPAFKKVVNPQNGYTTFSETEYVCPIVADPTLKPANQGPAIDPSFGVQPGTNQEYFDLILSHIAYIEERIVAIVAKLNSM